MNNDIIFQFTNAHAMFIFCKFFYNDFNCGCGMVITLKNFYYQNKSFSNFILKFT